jgi:polar amino acid transport system substrate-binding protein
MRKKLLAALAALMVATVACSPSSDAGAAKSTLDKVLERGTVKVAVLTVFPPIGYKDEKGDIVGFDIDVARLLAKSLFGDESKVELVPTSWEGRWSAVQTDLVDVGIMGTNMLEDRLARVAFTGVYFDTAAVVLVRKDANIEKVEDLNRPDVVVARLNTEPEAEHHRRHFPKAQELILEGQADMFAAVQSGRATAMQTSTANAYFNAKNDASTKVLPQTLDAPTRYGMFTKYGDFNWWLFLDNFVEEMRQGSLYGEYTAIYQKWFGVNPPPQNWYLDGANGLAK